MDSESKISSAEQRAARRDLWETARAAYDRPRQSQSEAMRDARRSVWEQAKAAGIQNDETPPPVPTGKETGLNDDPRIARLEGIVRDLAGRLDDLEDDYPESEIGNSAEAASVWSGIVYAGGVMVRDYNRVGFVPSGALLEHGMFGYDGDGVYQGSVDGEFVKVDRTTGDCEFVDADDETLFEDATQYEYFLVAEKTDDGYAAVENATCGDIHVFAGGSLEIAGTPAIYKVVMSLGWKKTSAEANWEQMTAAEVAANTPTRLWNKFVDGVDEYPWYAFRPTWDYPRTHA